MLPKISVVIPNNVDIIPKPCGNWYTKPYIHRSPPKFWFELTFIEVIIYETPGLNFAQDLKQGLDEIPIAERIDKT